MVLFDFVHHDLDRLRLIALMQPDRFIQVHFFLRQLVIVHQHHQVVALMLGIGLAQRNLDRPFTLESFGFRQVELVVSPLAALFEPHQFLMRPGNRTIQFITCRAKLAFEIGFCDGDLILRVLQLFLLFR